jgi:hypothetical protein
MALPIIGDVYRCSVLQHQRDMAVANVFHVIGDGSESAADVASAVMHAWGDDTGLCLLQSTEIDLDLVTVTPLDGSSTSASVDFSTTSNQTGQQDLIPSPPQVSMVCSLETSARGRSNRGRMYLAGQPDEWLATDRTSWDTTHVADAQETFDHWRGIMVAGDTSVHLGVASYKNAEFHATTSLIVRSYLGTQRMRARV